MAITPRCETAAAATATTYTLPLTGWTNAGLGVSGTAPAVGDIVFAGGTVNAASATITQTGGTGSWTVHSSDNNAGGAVLLTTWVAYRVFDGTETNPTFSFGASDRYTIAAAALAPDAGQTVSVDAWATTKIDTTAATGHTANAASVTATFTDCSLIFAGAGTQAHGTSAVTFAAPASWAVPSGASVSNTGTSGTYGYGAVFFYRTGQTGTVTPGAATLEGGSSGTGTTFANLYHVLVKESGAAGVTVTAGLPAAAGAPPAAAADLTFAGPPQAAAYSGSYLPGVYAATYPVVYASAMDATVSTSPAAAPTAAAAVAAGAALQPGVSGSPGVTPTAGLAAGTGTALAPATNVTNAPAGLATGTGAAQTAAAVTNIANVNAGLATATGGAGQPFAITFGALGPLDMAESLIVGGVIELLNGGYVVSQLPGCAGASFGLGGAGDTWDMGAPQPVVDVLATLLSDGEVPLGRRASNRTMTLPVVIRAPDLSTLAQARETLFATVNQPYWQLMWRRPGGNLFTFDCFRAAPTVITYSLEDQDAFLSRILLTFEALPYGRGATQQTLTFSSPLSGQPAPPSPVTVDSFSTVASTTQAPWWASAPVAVTGTASAKWDFDGTDLDSAPIYTRTLAGTVNITGLTVLSFWFGLGSPEHYSDWHKGNIAFAVILSDNSGHTLSFGTTVYCYASNSGSAPTWNRVSLPIPNSATFDYAHVASYSIKLWRKIRDDDDDLFHDADAYLNGLVASPSTAPLPATTRGTVYQLQGILGSAHTPLAVTFQQAINPLGIVTDYTTPGAIQFIPPAGITSIDVKKWGAGGLGGGVTAAGPGGGAAGGEFCEIASFGCTPGVPINGYVGAPGAVGGGGFVQRVASGHLDSTSITSCSGNVLNVTTGGQTLLVSIGFNSTTAVVSSVTDTQGNSYAKDYAAPTGTTGQRRFEVWRCPTATALTPADTITVTFTTAVSNGAAWICDQYIPLGTPDMTNYNWTSSTVSSLNVTGTMLADDTVGVAAVCVMAQNESPAVSTFTATGADQSGGGANHNVDVLAAYLPVPSAGSKTAAFSWDDTKACVGVILGYPAVAAAAVNGQDTWFGAYDATAAHGGLGVAPNTPGGAVGQTGTATGVTVRYAGGNGATGSTTGGGGGSSAGTGSAGNAGSGATGGAAPTGGAAGGAGGAAGGVHAGTGGGSPGAGGGGAFTTGANAPGGQGGAGKIEIAYTAPLATYQTLIAHMPGARTSSASAPQALVPLVAAGSGSNPPDGREYPIPAFAAGVNARFDGTYTIVLTNFTFSSPGNARTVTITVRQYDYPGGPSSSASVARTFTPATDIANGMIIVDNLTLPVKKTPPDNASAYFTVAVSCTSTSDRYLDVLFIDTQGQLAYLNISDANAYSTYWLDEPTPTEDLGLLSGSVFDRSSAVSVMQYAIISGGPLTAEPGNNSLLVYGIEGQPAIQVAYTPRYWVDDPGSP